MMSLSRQERTDIVLDASKALEDSYFTNRQLENEVKSMGYIPHANFARDLFDIARKKYTLIHHVSRGVYCYSE